LLAGGSLARDLVSISWRWSLHICVCTAYRYGSLDKHWCDVSVVPFLSIRGWDWRDGGVTVATVPFISFFFIVIASAGAVVAVSNERMFVNTNSKIQGGEFFAMSGG
jgi:hypothetical protein